MSRSSIPRLSTENSRRFAKLLQRLLKECRLTVYSLFIEVEYPRATLTRWVNGKSPIPVDAALTLVQQLTSYADSISSSPALKELHALIQAQCAEDQSASRLREELRARRIPIRRTLEALRAANMLPSESSVS